jgi:phosphoribosylanthranilate isomerase
MKGRVRIKICGMTRLADALCAAEAGVDALGFIFFARSPRCIEQTQARRIAAALPPLVHTVGVFVNEEIRAAADTIRACGLSLAQLHGSERPDYCRELARIAAPCRIIKAIRVGPKTTASEIAPYAEAVSGFLLDTFAQDTVGGTGQAFDWSQIARLGLNRPFLLAGGLDPDNITTALNSVRPYGVDANSGLETAPGHKDHDLIRRFIAAVRAFENGA